MTCDWRPIAVYSVQAKKTQTFKIDKRRRKERQREVRQHAQSCTASHKQNQEQSPGFFTPRPMPPLLNSPEPCPGPHRCRSSVGINCWVSWGMSMPWKVLSPISPVEFTPERQNGRRSHWDPFLHRTQQWSSVATGYQGACKWDWCRKSHPAWRRKTSIQMTSVPVYLQYCDLLLQDFFSQCFCSPSNLLSQRKLFWHYRVKL